MPLNFNYISSEKIFLNSNNDLGMEEIWDRKQYLEYFFPFVLKEKFKFKGLDFFKARNITINAKAGDTHFSLQWVFSSLASALDVILLVKICDKNQPLRICKHCGKLFIAENEHLLKYKKWKASTEYIKQHKQVPIIDLIKPMHSLIIAIFTQYLYFIMQDLEKMKNTI